MSLHDRRQPHPCSNSPSKPTTLPFCNALIKLFSSWWGSLSRLLYSSKYTASLNATIYEIAWHFFCKNKSEGVFKHNIVDLMITNIQIKDMKWLIHVSYGKKMKSPSFPLTEIKNDLNVKFRHIVPWHSLWDQTYSN